MGFELNGLRRAGTSKFYYGFSEGPGDCQVGSCKRLPATSRTPSQSSLTREAVWAVKGGASPGLVVPRGGRWL